MMPLTTPPAQVADDDQLTADEPVPRRTVAVEAKPQPARRAIAVVVRPGQIEVDRAVGGVTADVEGIDREGRRQVDVGVALEPQRDRPSPGAGAIREVSAGGVGEFVL